MAAVTFINSATATNNTSNATDTVVSKPASVVDGDLLIAVFFGSNTNTTVSTLTGWTALDSSIGTDGSMSVFWKIAASEGSSYDWSHANIGTQILCAAILAFRNTATTAPLGVYSKNADNTSDTTANGSAINPDASPGGAVVMAVGARAVASSVSAYTIPNNNPSWTEPFDINASNGGSGTMSAAYGSYDVTGTTGAPTATLANAAVSTTFLMFIRPTAPSFASPVMAITTAEPTPAQAVGLTVVPFAVTTSEPVSALSTAGSKWTNTGKSTTTWTNPAKS